MRTDHQGSIILITDSAANVLAKNSYDDQMNLYAYVANDPVNHTDPTGTSCTITPQKNGGSTVSCKVDDAKSFYDAGYSKTQVQSLAKNYANAVARSLEAGDRKITVSVNGRSLQTTGNQIASGLARSYVSLAPSNGERATLVGGPLSNGSDLRSVLNRANPMNLPYRLNVDRNMFYDTPRDGLTLDQQQSRTFVHEGIHSAPGEAAMRGMPVFNVIHQNEYSSEASEILRGI